MITECAVLVLLTLVIAYLFMRQEKRGTAASILPLAVLPSVCLLGYALRTRLPPSLLSPQHWYILFVMAGLAGGITLFGIIAKNIKRTSARRMYLLLCGGFTMLFAFAEILNILKI